MSKPVPDEFVSDRNPGNVKNVKDVFGKLNLCKFGPLTLITNTAE